MTATQSVFDCVVELTERRLSISVAEGPACQQPAGQHDGVTVDDPLMPGQAGVQACADVGESEVDDGDVEFHQKHSGTHRGQHDVALSTAVVGRVGVPSKGGGLSRHAVSSAHTSKAWWRTTSPDDELTSAQTVGMSTSSPRTAATNGTATQKSHPLGR